MEAECQCCSGHPAISTGNQQSSRGQRWLRYALGKAITPPIEPGPKTM
jgi:hypothetical protein